MFRQTYEGRPPVDHLDFYRIDDPRELAELGLDDAFAPDRVTLVEWPERAHDWLPQRRIDVAIEGSGAQPRTVAVTRLP